jgi:hypothetical protein
VFHFLQLLLKLVLKVDEELPDNSRLASSILIGGAWLILIAELFRRQLGLWRDWCFWGGWICVVFALFLFLRRLIWKWQGKQPKRSHSMMWK